jgi:phosphoglycerate kinase
MSIRYLSKTDPKKLSGIAILRLDFNTEDAWRLEAAIPTIKFLLKRAQAVIVVSHRGRPKGAEEKFSLKNDAATLSDILHSDAVFIPHFRFTEIKKALTAAPRGSLFVLENIRFLPGEDSNDARLAKEIASLGDYFVNEAFAVSHRNAASIVSITKHLPSYAGLGLEKEIASLGNVLKNPAHPFIVVVGGGKAQDKLEVLKNFKAKADAFLLGGAAANTMLALRGHDVGASLVDKNSDDLRVLKPFAASNRVIVPGDWRMEKNAILDIGPRTGREYARILGRAKTILWAGPMGFIENKKFEKGNLAVARAIAANRKAFSVTGGGETVMFLKKYKLDAKFSFISTGGGAMLEFLAGKKLPGIEALK